MSKDELVVVAGAGGFIGGALVSYLHQRGFSRIRAVDKKNRCQIGTNAFLASRACALT